VCPEAQPDFLSRAQRILSGDIRPEDYLPTTPDVEAGVKLDLAFAAEHIRSAWEAGRIPAVFEPDSSVSTRQRNARLLSAHYGGQNVAYIENERGVIVLAVGLEQGGALIDAFPYDMRKDVGFGAPPPADTIDLL
jgi:hypothetical protein